MTVNPDEPPMPGKVQYEQAKGFVKAFLAGQPRRATIASTLFRDKIAEIHVMTRRQGSAGTHGHAGRRAEALIGIDRLLQQRPPRSLRAEPVWPDRRRCG